MNYGKPPRHSQKQGGTAPTGSEQALAATTSPPPTPSTTGTSGSTRGDSNIFERAKLADGEYVGEINRNHTPVLYTINGNKFVYTATKTLCSQCYPDGKPTPAGTRPPLTAHKPRCPSHHCRKCGCYGHHTNSCHQKINATTRVEQGHYADEDIA